MRGSLNIPFSTLVQDTIRVHGLAWAAREYKRCGLPLWQFAIFAGLKTKGL